MTHTTATVFDIQRCSLHDGPGIRTTVFLKGCPLRCLWCHNPESMDSRPQLAFTASRCIGCRECLRACPNGVHAIVEGKRVINRGLCQRCGRCVEVCHSEALELMGREMALEEVLAEVARDQAFYASSGGGVTLSGGEPLLQPEFATAFLQACRRQGLHTVLDTSGYAPWESLLAVAREADLVLFDLKHTDDARHRELTSVSNRVILDNLARLASEQIDLRVRAPVIPGCNDEEDNYRTMAAYLGRLDVRTLRVDLLPYHQLGSVKHSRLGTEYGLHNVKPPTSERLESLASILRTGGFQVQVGG